MATFSVVILTAAPNGQAAEAGGAFVKIDGREALLRSVELFLNRDPVKQIQVVIPGDAMEEAKRKYGPHLSFSGVKLVAGGSKWYEQITAAGAKISPEATHVIVHDAARPVVAFSDIDALFEVAENEEAVTLVTPVRSELIQVDDTGNPLHHWRADEFVQQLTPRCYSKSRFEAVASQGEAGDRIPSKLLKGSPLNVRIRGAGDASLAKAMMGLLPKPKIKAATSPFDEAQW